MDTGSELELLFRAVLALVVVVVLAVVSLRFGLPWLLRRPLAGRPRRLEVEERCSLDRHHHLFRPSPGISQNPNSSKDPGTHRKTTIFFVCTNSPATRR